jgi:hypothetical protein
VGIDTYLEKAITQIINEQVAKVNVEEKKREKGFQSYEMTPDSKNKNENFYNNIKSSLFKKKNNLKNDFIDWLNSKRTCDANSYTVNPDRPCNILYEIFTKIKEDNKKISTQDAAEIKSRIIGLQDNVYLGRKIDEITVESSGGKRHKRSVHKRSVHKRSVHKRSVHKRSVHKRSRHKRSRHKRSRQ